MSEKPSRRREDGDGGPKSKRAGAGGEGHRQEHFSPIRSNLANALLEVRERVRQQLLYGRFPSSELSGRVMSQATGFKLARLILDYCEVLAWPVVVLVCVGMFRMEIRSLLDRLRHLKAFGAESSFDSGLTKLSREQQAEKERADALEVRSGQPGGVDGSSGSEGTEAEVRKGTAQVYRRILAQLEREFGVAPEADVVWKGRPDMVFDAYIKTPEPIFVEIKAAKASGAVDAATTQLREKLKELERDIGVKARGIVVVATSAENLPRLVESARLAKQKHKGIDVRIYDIDLLNP